MRKVSSTKLLVLSLPWVGGWLEEQRARLQEQLPSVQEVKANVCGSAFLILKISKCFPPLPHWAINLECQLSHKIKFGGRKEGGDRGLKLYTISWLSAMGPFDNYKMYGIWTKEPVLSFCSQGTIEACEHGVGRLCIRVSPFSGTLFPHILIQCSFDTLQWLGGDLLYR